MINSRNAIKAEQSTLNAWIDAGNSLLTSALPPNPATLATLEWMNFENLKIAAGFELVLKAILLENDYIVQKIDRNDARYTDIAKTQRQTPIRKSDIFAIDEYRFDGQRNYIPGLLTSSIDFSTIVEKMNYRAATQLPLYELDLIDEFRKLRNQIHFPGDYPDTPKLNAHPAPIVDFVVKFINEQLIDRANRLRAKHRLTYQLLDQVV